MCHRWATTRRTSSRLFRCVVFVCASLYCPFSHLHTLWHHIVPWQVGYANGSLSGSRSKTHPRRPMWKNGFSSLMLLLNDPIPQNRVMSSLRLQGYRCLSYRHHGNQRKPRTQLVLGSVLRHHCLCCSHDLHVNVWNYPSRVMLYCQATRILSPQDRITLPCGVRWALTRSWPNTWLTFTKLWQIPWRFLKEISLPLLSHKASTSTFLLNQLCRRGSASTTGTLGPDVERKTLLRNKLRGNGILLPCKKHLIMSNTLFFKNDFTWPTLRAARFSSTRTPSTLTSDISVKSIYLHDRRRGVQDQVVEGEQGRVLQGVLSRASFRRAAVSGQKFFTVLSLHISNIWRQEERHRQEAHPASSCHYDFSRSWPGSRWFQWNSLGMSQPWQSQYYWWSLCWLPCLRHRAPHRCGTRIHPEQLGRRLWISQLTRIAAFLESK